MENRFFAQSSDTLKVKNNDCTILIFGENHDKKHGIDLVESVSKYLRKTTDDSITYAFEHPKSDTREMCEHAHRSSARILMDEATHSLRQIINIKSEIDDYHNLLKQKNVDAITIKKLIALSEIRVKELEADVSKKLNSASIHYSKAIFHSQLDRLKIEFASIDMTDDALNLNQETINANKTLASTEFIDIRDKHMVDQVVPLLDKSKVLIVHVGELHIKGIIDQLIERGVNPDKITGYVIKSESALDTDQELISSYKKMLSDNSITQEMYDKKVDRLLPHLSSKTSRVIPILMNDNANKDAFEQSAKQLVDDVQTLHQTHKI